MTATQSPRGRHATAARPPRDRRATAARWLQVRIESAETVLAFCAGELNVLSHVRRNAEAAARAAAATRPGLGTRAPNVLVFMVDATSRAHFRRSLPRTLAALETIAALGKGAGAASTGGEGGGAGGHASHQPAAAPASWRLVHGGGECGSADTSLGDQASVEACAKERRAHCSLPLTPARRRAATAL